jgi:hypothetical protein
MEREEEGRGNSQMGTMTEREKDEKEGGRRER